jgi:branched-chain amino acid transport system substrate-binding protein
MDKRSLIKAMVAAPLAVGMARAQAQATPFKIALLTPMTGPFASTGRQMEAGARLYMAQRGSTVAGR